MNDVNVGEALGINSENVRKYRNGFKRVEIYLSNLERLKKNFYSLNLQCSYFQKIHNSDWNEVLIHLNSIKKEQ